MTNQGPWPGRFVWHDMMTTDANETQQFYCSLFDWKIQEIPMQGGLYRMIVTGPGPMGGIVEEKNIPMSHWMPYIAVADVDAAAKKIQSLKGSVCVPPTDIPGTGRFAVVGDPQGAYFSIYKGNAGSAGFDPDQPVPGSVCWNELLSTDDEQAQAFYSAMFGWREQPKDMGPMGTYRVQLLGDNQEVAIHVNSAHALDAGKAHELWVLPAKGDPVSLGLLPTSGEARRPLTAAQRAALAGAKQLAVSLEPAGGSPTGLPTGPVLHVAPLTSV